ncbi:MAG: acetoin utilization protein AcuC [Chlorobi bacterium]|nr:acetoin utilization protein AcuC [Chlorobiota bacterium]
MCRIIYSEKYNLYNLGPEHPFSPLRVEMVIDLIRSLGLNFEFTEPSAVSPEELEAVHDKEYIQAVEDLSAGKEVAGFSKYGFGTQDNPIVKGMAEGARYHAGGTLLGAKTLLNGDAKKVIQFGGGLHHAQSSMASGFCIYNDLAVAIKEMTNAGWHVAYLDLDVHHGDGVQKMFYSDGEVMTISLHESGEFLYPGSGWVYELGQGMGRSLKINVPLEPFTEGDSYLEAVKKVVAPALSWFRPDALVIQSGADPHFSDPLADLLLTAQDFEKIYREVITLADKHCKGRALFTFGGGYSLTATPRIWALLYLILKDIPVPEKLPAEWKEKWEKKLNKKFPETFYDPLPAYDEIPRKPEIVRTNKDTYQRIMDSVAADWL